MNQSIHAPFQPLGGQPHTPLSTAAMQAPDSGIFSAGWWRRPTHGTVVLRLDDEPEGSGGARALHASLVNPANGKSLPLASERGSEHCAVVCGRTGDVLAMTGPADDGESLAHARLFAMSFRMLAELRHTVALLEDLGASPDRADALRSRIAALLATLES
jgi:hypothetical protein